VSEKVAVLSRDDGLAQDLGDVVMRDDLSSFGREIA
jgi:hypothetical protein